MKSRRHQGDPTVAVGYLRVSTDEQLLGPEAQCRAIEDWCRARGVSLVAVFLDQGVSGATPAQERKGLRDTVSCLRDTGAGIMVAAMRCRLARDTSVAKDVERMVVQAGAVVATADGMSEGAADEPSGMMTRGISDLVAAVYRAQVRSNTRRALAVKKARGEYMGGLAPFGFVNVPGGIAPCPEEQAVVARVQELRAQGNSLRAIVASLTDAGLVSRSGRPFQRTQIVRILGAGK